jgi:hypothetical protein
MDWRTVILQFQKALAQEQGLHSVKDLCNGLLHQFKLKTYEEIMAYLQDYVAVSQSHLKFHRKWEKIPNMGNSADYDEKEIAKVEELMQLLSETVTM